MIEIIITTLIGIAIMIMTVCTMSCLIIASETDDYLLGEQQYIN